MHAWTRYENVRFTTRVMGRLDLAQHIVLLLIRTGSFGRHSFPAFVTFKSKMEPCMRGSIHEWGPESYLVTCCRYST